MNKTQQLHFALELRKENKLIESNEQLLQLVEHYPNDAYLHYQCAWSFDVLGEEAKAVSHYEKAIQGDLNDEDMANAYLGLGSTFRTLGKYEQSQEILCKAIQLFPKNQALQVFYAMTLYNLNDHQTAMELLLNCISNSSTDVHVQKYKRAIQFYADKLDETWS
ncbi:tetratricopeptide repeat protein [Metasolibacillus meyeri]|uniref:Tetratricopeptide repeat protein n=1 Tax=Metasolibacillus meyeri TaxID=1071052 RepID=A0AAW9NRW3_9BACL|nr:tetratricopeptide repeat protein [Metasolibacillus meyeri]MEC1180285.1 tetratricopeptide repeat protein [Metasolibacillus meyeri]